MSTLRFEINHTSCEVEVQDRCSLTEHLRDHLGLTGTRLGCAQEQCGACMVLIDGLPRHSCQIEIGHLAGRSVHTVESLTDSKEGRMLLAQFEAYQAAQCGFCLSGILIQGLAFVRQSADGSRDALVRALDRHLCRCGAHPRIMAAIQACWNDLHAKETGR